MCTRTDRHFVADDDVLLKTLEVVGAATGGSVDQHASRVLERRSRQPAITPDTHLGDTKQQLCILGWRLALGNELLVGINH